MMTRATFDGTPLILRNQHFRSTAFLPLSYPSVAFVIDSGALSLLTKRHGKLAPGSICVITFA